MPGAIIIGCVLCLGVAPGVVREKLLSPKLHTLTPESPIFSYGLRIGDAHEWPNLRRRRLRPPDRSSEPKEQLILRRVSAYSSNTYSYSPHYIVALRMSRLRTRSPALAEQHARMHMHTRMHAYVRVLTHALHALTCTHVRMHAHSRKRMRAHANAHARLGAHRRPPRHRTAFASASTALRGKAAHIGRIRPGTCAPLPPASSAA